jgi:hypothetical protein
VWNYSVKLSPHKCQMLAGRYRVKKFWVCAFLSLWRV